MQRQSEELDSNKKRKEEQDSTNIIFGAIKEESGREWQRGPGAYVRVEAPLNERAKKAAEKAGVAALTALPVYTGMGLIMIIAGQSKEGGERVGIMRAMGVPVLIGGFLVDVVKWPFHLVYATAKAAEAGVTKIASAVMEGTPQYEFEQTMLNSFIIRLAETARLLDALDPEKTDLEQKLQTGDINDLIGITLLHTAFDSRYYLGDVLKLSDGRALRREDCPPIGMDLFNTVIAAKNLINEALGGNPQMHNDELLRRDSNIVARWLPLIRKGQPVQVQDVPGADANSIVTINKLIAMLEPLSRQAKAILPVEPTVVGERVNSFRK